MIIMLLIIIRELANLFEFVWFYFNFIYINYIMDAIPNMNAMLWILVTLAAVAGILKVLGKKMKGGAGCKVMRGGDGWDNTFTRMGAFGLLIAAMFVLVFGGIIFLLQGKKIY